MAKILVADDNSNIQKMVGLALKDQGIDVVAVGNGEAAVRKISDIRPDLVLADVFMPVRNGYEVCKYVKDDSSLAHIPVILLVGAFDPLDEQEAQRVGADGVLKKPFVPPDPLISMVKSALARAGVLPSDKPAEPPPMAAVDMIAPRVPDATQAPGFSDFGQHEPTDHVAAPEPVRMDSGAPLAFGSLLETPVAKEEEEEVPYMTGASTHTAPERTWRSPDEPEEVEEEEEPRSSWRRDGEELEDDGTVGDGGAGDWRDTVMADTPTRRSARESWEPARAAKEEPVTVATTETLPAPTVISAGKPASAPFAGDAWAAAISPNGDEAKAVPMAIEQAPVVEQAPAVVEETKPEAARGGNSSMAENWFSPAPSSPWDAELKKASDLATAWDSPKAEEPVSAYASEVIVKEEAAPEAVAAEEPSVEAAAQEAGLSSSTVEAIREEAAHVAETSPVSVAGPAAEPKMDDLIAKVLAKMSPEVLQAVTREILKPVVEAMVRDELNAKKS